MCLKLDSQKSSPILKARDISDRLLTKADIAEGITVLDESVFQDCANLSEVVFPKSLLRIRQYAFSGCTALKELTIAQTVESLGAGLFCGCTSLERVILPENLTKIGSRFFYGCSALSEVTLPFIQEIYMEAFAYCSSIKTIHFPEGLTRIGKRAFCEATGLTKVAIPSSVIRIEEDAFSGCNQLKSVTIPIRFLGQIKEIFGQDGFDELIFI